MWRTRGAKLNTNVERSCSYACGCTPPGQGTLANHYVAVDHNGDTIRLIHKTTAAVSTLVNGGNGYTNGNAASAQIYGPYALIVCSAGQIRPPH